MARRLADLGVRHYLPGRQDKWRALEEVIRAGFGNKAWIRRDPDLVSLRDDPRFQALVAGD